MHQIKDENGQTVGKLVLKDDYEDQHVKPEDFAMVAVVWARQDTGPTDYKIDHFRAGLRTTADTDPIPPWAGETDG